MESTPDYFTVPNDCLLEYIVRCFSTMLFYYVLFILQNMIMFYTGIYYIHYSRMCYSILRNYIMYYARMHCNVILYAVLHFTIQNVTRLVPMCLLEESDDSGPALGGEDYATVTPDSKGPPST